jgi:CheY-like chemotaxis protein
MPVMDGDAMLRIMAEVPILVRIPMVVVSSMPEVREAERCSGYAGFLRGPFRIAEVVALVERLTGKGAAFPG